MKEKLHRFFSLFMALLLLASTTSWTVGKHYCMGRLMDVSFFAHAEDCGMAMPAPDNGKSNLHDDKSCCSDELFVVTGQDDLKLSFNDYSLDQQLFLVVFSHSYLNLFELQKEQLVPHNHYPPPILVKDIHVLDQIFLI